MKEYYPGNTYKTPPQRKSSIIDFIFLRSRFWFYLRVGMSILKYNRKYTDRGLYTSEVWAMESKDIRDYVEDCGGRFDISGINHIRSVKNRPVVFIGNHMGLLETMILPGIIAPVVPITFVVKQSLLDFPAFGKIMRATRPIVVGRENPREDLITVLTEGKDNLEKGISVVLFPQSTRQAFFDPAQFNSLGIKLALRAKAAVVPFTLKTDFLENGKIWKDFGKLNRKNTVYIKFGESIEPKGNGKAEQKRIIGFISENLRKWGGRVL